MKLPSTNRPVIQVVGASDGWIHERLGRRLAAKLPYAEFAPAADKPRSGIGVRYYVNYFLYNGPSGAVDVGFFTHLDDSNEFLERARKMDFCVCMSRKYENWLLDQGVKAVTCIPMGFDSYRYRPKLVLGVVGLLDHPRKGIHAYPKRWFEEIGGFDLEFEGWGFEDSDLRIRAQKSIGIYNDKSALLIHQWHPHLGDVVTTLANPVGNTKSPPSRRWAATGRTRRCGSPGFSSVPTRLAWHGGSKEGRVCGVTFD
jgi:hypothetical protein